MGVYPKKIFKGSPKSGVFKMAQNASEEAAIRKEFGNRPMDDSSAKAKAPKA